MLLEVYKPSYGPNNNGPLSLLFFPLIAAVPSAVFLTSLILGLPLRQKRLRYLWCSTFIPTSVLILIAGLSFQWAIDNANLAYIQLHLSTEAAATILLRKTTPGFVGIIFATLHWPRSRDITWPKSAADQTLGNASE